VPWSTHRPRSDQSHQSIGRGGWLLVHAITGGRPYDRIEPAAQAGDHVQPRPIDLSIRSRPGRASAWRPGSIDRSISCASGPARGIAASAWLAAGPASPAGPAGLGRQTENDAQGAEQRDRPAQPAQLRHLSSFFLLLCLLPLSSLCRWATKLVH
jgi:hypothetical protein